MPVVRTSSACTLSLAVALAAGSASAQTCPPSDKPRADAHGDPLPAGAVARLGTVRMRHASGISGAAFAPDGKSIVTSEYYGGVHVWDVATGRELRHIYADDYLSHCLAVSPDGRTLAVGLGDLKVRLYDLAAGRELGVLPTLTERYGRLVFSPDGSRLATSVLSSRAVAVWDVATQRLVREVRFPEAVGGVTFAADAKALVGIAESGEPIAVDVADGSVAGPARGRPVRRDRASDTTALVWDAANPLTRHPVARRADVSARFADLASDDAEWAYASIWALVENPDETVRYLAGQDELFTRPKADDIRRWVRELDSAAFADRDRASRELGLVLDDAEAHLRETLRGTPSAEVRERIERLLQARERGPTGLELQRLRVIETLEHVAANPGIRPAAAAVLRKLAAALPEARSARDAAAAAARVARRADRVR